MYLYLYPVAVSGCIYWLFKAYFDTIDKRSAVKWELCGRHNCSHSWRCCCCCCCCPFAFAFLLQIWNRFRVLPSRVTMPTYTYVYLGQFHSRRMALPEFYWLPQNCVLRTVALLTFLWVPFLLLLRHSYYDWKTMLKFFHCTPHGVCAIFTFVSYPL